MATQLAKVYRRAPERPVAFSEDDVLASILKDSYSEFLREFWDIISPEPLHWNWHLDLLCDEVQDVADRVVAGEPREYDLIANLPPGMTKSIVFSIALTPWVWTKFPQCRVIGNSFAHTLSLDHSRRSRDIVLSDKYRALFPHVVLREDQNAKGNFMNTLGGMRYATSTNGSVTGMHGHIIVSDDPVDPAMAGSMTEAEMKTANLWQNETLPSRKVNKKVSVILMVMQRVSVSDPTATRLEQKKVPVRHICLPADCREYPVKPKSLTKNYVDGLLDPERLPREVLDEQEATLGAFGYAGQYGQSPIPRSGGMFHVDKLKIIPALPADRPIARAVRYWDKAGTEGGGAFTAGVRMVDLGKDHVPRFIVFHVTRFQKDSWSREREIRNYAEADGKGTEVGVEQEPGSGGKESAENTQRNLAGFRVFVDKVTGEKAVRADPFSVQVNAGNVALVRGLWNADFVDEMRVYPNGKFKDQIDAAAGAFNRLSHPRAFFGAII